jgi:hypothetical protein
MKTDVKAGGSCGGGGRGGTNQNQVGLVNVGINNSGNILSGLLGGIALA